MNANKKTKTVRVPKVAAKKTRKSGPNQKVAPKNTGAKRLVAKTRANRGANQSSREIPRGKSIRGGGRILALAKSIANPEFGAPLRTLKDLSGVRTASAKLHTTEALLVNNTQDESDLMVSDGSTPIIMFDSQLCQYIAYDINEAGNWAEYSMVFYGVSNPSWSDAQPPGLSAQLTLDNDSEVHPINFVYLNLTANSGDWAPHENYFFPRRIKDLSARFVWINASDVISLATVGLLTGDSNNVQSYYLEGEEVTNAEYFPMTFSTPSASTSTVLKPGYYCFTYETNSTATTTTLTINVRVNADCFGHHHSELVESMFPSIDFFRVNAHSIRLTNTTSVLNKGGSQVSRQMPGSRAWWLTSMSYNTVASLPDVMPCEVTKGSFLFWKPTSLSDFDWKREWSWDSAQGILSDAWSYIYSERQYLLTTFIPSDPLTFAGFYFPAQKVEYQTLNQWIGTEEPTTSESDLKLVLEILVKMPQFYDNPSHAEDIWNNIKSWGAKIAGIVDQAIPVVSGIISSLT